MSLFAALFTGVSGLSAQSQKLSTIANNIANSNTTGYKRVNAEFYSLVTTTGIGAAYSPGGVTTKVIGTQSEQGVLQQTNNPTDMAISGDGYFVTRTNPSSTADVLYTRAGSFQEDQGGYLRNTAGDVLYAWPIDATGNIPASNADLSSLSPVNISFIGGLTSATSSVTAGINLNATETNVTGVTVAAAKASPPTLPTVPAYSRQVTVYDSLGYPQKLELQFYKHNPADTTDTTPPPGDFASQSALVRNNSWYVQVRNVANNAIVSNPTPVVFANGDGKLTAPTTDIGITNISWGNGSKPQNINLDLSNVTQFSSAYNVVSVAQNGAELGLRTSVAVDKDGYIFANFSNGQTQRLYKVPLATFTNSNGLSEVTGNSYLPTTYSGTYNLREPGLSGAGTISPSSLEASNVDLADEFSKMIVTQRAYSANTKVITTANEMLNDLLASVR